MKVSEAKTKICPFMSITFAADTEHLRSGGLIEQYCICGDCMAWEYTKTHKRKILETTFIVPKGWNFIEYNTNNNMVCVQDIDENEKEGYCKRITNDA